MINKPAPEHRRCPSVQSSGPERALQGERGSPGLSGPSTATDPAPKFHIIQRDVGVFRLLVILSLRAFLVNLISLI